MADRNQTAIGDNSGRPFHAGVYVDPALTTSGAVSQTADDQGGLGRTGNLPQRTDVYDKAGTDFEPGDQGAPVYPHAPNYNKLGRDPYAVGGMDDEVNPES